MFSSLSFLSFFFFCSSVCIVHASDVCVLNAAPLLDVRPSPPLRPTCRDPCGSLFLHPHFVMLQRCLSAFTSRRAPLPIKTTVSHVFFTLFSFFFFCGSVCFVHPLNARVPKCGPCMPPPLAAQKLRLPCPDVLMNAAACILCRVSPFVLFFPRSKS